MTETGPSFTRVHHDRKPRRRRCLISCCLIFSLIILALVLTAVILAVTLFRPKDPTTTLISANVTGISPRVSLMPLNIQINVTLDIVIRVHNPNYASFSHQPGKSQLYYRAAQVGEADVAEGKIPARGDSDVNARLVVDGSSVTKELSDLAGDLLSGEIGLDTKTRLDGKVTILGFVRRKAVATSDCHLVVAVSEMKVKSQQCTDKTKL